MKYKQIGFTLIELMVTVAIVGILAAIAIPSYQESVRKSRRTDAEGVLFAFANGMERYFTLNNTYCDAGGGSGTAKADCGVAATLDTGTPSASVYRIPTETAKYYTVTIDDITNDGSGYVLIAEPTGPQTGDKCGKLTLNQVGAKGVTGNDVSVNADDCW